MRTAFFKRFVVAKRRVYPPWNPQIVKEKRFKPKKIISHSFIKTVKKRFPYNFKISAFPYKIHICHIQTNKAKFWERAYLIFSRGIVLSFTRQRKRKLRLQFLLCSLLLLSPLWSKIKYFVQKNILDLISCMLIIYKSLITLVFYDT